MPGQTAKLSIRLDLPNGSRFGPGKAALLDAVRTERSINGAARALNMSYPRALKLVVQMNESFATPLIQSQKGGSSGGGADLTDAGLVILELYFQLCKDTETATADSLALLTQRIRQN